MKRILLSVFALTLFVNLSFAQVMSIGLIGEGTPLANWDEDIDMVQDAADTSMWTMNIMLGDGPVKFRANDDWALNWGNPDPAAFMSGIGEQGADNFQAFAGEYNITFNHVSGAYTFDYVSDIGMIGPATPNADWDNDVNMYRDQTDPSKFFSWVNLSTEAVKFRKDDDWAVSWGSADFPTGTATLGGDNIPVSPGAFYYVTLDTLTGAYSFDAETTYDSLSLIGEGTINADWDTDVYMTKDANDGHVWTGLVELVGGGIKFRANTDWTTSWGSLDWPMGTGVLGGDNIPSEAGTYFVSFNSDSGDYNFVEVGSYSTIGIIGTATPNGWNDPDTDLVQDANDEAIWTTRLTLLDGEAKFRANDAWDYSWGAAEFPTGTGTLNGTVNIPVTAGDYIIEFNSITGFYNFKPVVEYDFIGIIGKSSPLANWDDDVELTKDAADFNMWTATDVVLTDHTGEDDSGIKFRVDRDWAINWGTVDFPTGVGTAGGANIVCTAGTWAVAFNSANGEYAFSEGSGTENLLNPSDLKVFPNPASDRLNIDLTAVELSGTVKLQVVDMTGKIVMNTAIDAYQLKSINISALNSGTYLLNLSNDQFMISKRFSVAK